MNDINLTPIPPKLPMGYIGMYRENGKWIIQQYINGQSLIIGSYVSRKKANRIYGKYTKKCYANDIMNKIDMKFGKRL